MKKSNYLWLLGALVVGLLVRVPGVFWGFNFPAGWAMNHVDEYTHWVIAEHMIDPSTPLRWYHPYPKGMATHVTIPWMIFRVLTGRLKDAAPGMVDIVVTGRIFSVLYGTLTILVVFLIARKLFKDIRIGLFAAWIFALGGLHVTQSHFFLADAAVLFWSLLGSYFLLVDLESKDVKYFAFFMASAFSFGMAFGIKMVVMGLPSLAIGAVIRKPKIIRIIYGLAFFISAFSVINLMSFGYNDLYDIFIRRSADPYIWNRLSSVFLYLIESPYLVSLPILLLSITGGIALVKKWVSVEYRQRFWPIFLAILLPAIIEFVFVVIIRKHFPRHLVPFIPYMSIAAAWSLVWIMDRLRANRIHPAWIVAPLFIYLALFVFDNERVFIQDPRNEAAEWLYENVPEGSTYWWQMHHDLPGYVNETYPENKPEIILIEMHNVNHILSGLGWRNSYPRDYIHIFDPISQEYVDKLQALFKNETDYREVARFSEGYFMPEYVIINQLLGDRSRNYVTEIVVFKRE